MRFKIKNLGIIHEADIELGDITIVCGKNNTGKSYAGQAVYNFLDNIGNDRSLLLSRRQIVELAKGATTVECGQHLERIEQIGEKIAWQTSRNIKGALGRAPTDTHQGSGAREAEIGFSSGLTETNLLNGIEDIAGLAGPEGIRIRISDDRNKYDVSLASGDQASQNRPDIPRSAEENDLLQDRADQPDERLDNFHRRLLRRLTHEFAHKIFPRPFIVSAERTGAQLFHKELDFTRRNLLDILGNIFDGDAGRAVDQLAFFKRFTGKYPLVVKENLNFINNLDTVSRNRSFLTEEHPEIFSLYQNMLGGKYKISKEGGVYFQTTVENSGETIDLSLAESSTTVRSMLVLYFYLKSVARKGDLLIIDEPELGLHPNNQRKLARLLARVSNLGIKLFITTHSDYFIKELNTLIMLSQNSPRIKSIGAKYNYDEAEHLRADKIKAYTTEDVDVGLLLADGSGHVRYQRFKEAEIDQGGGIYIDPFDENIEEMNRVQDSIIWGD